MALVCDVYCDFVTFPFGILGQVWYLVVSIPDPCCLSYFKMVLLTPKIRVFEDVIVKHTRYNHTSADCCLNILVGLNILVTV